MLPPPFPLPEASALSRDVLRSAHAQVLRASHYRLLTKTEWDMATSEQFQLTFPTTVNWEYMDVEMLTKFWCRCPPGGGGVSPGLGTGGVYPVLGWDGWGGSVAAERLPLSGCGPPAEGAGVVGV